MKNLLEALRNRFRGPQQAVAAFWEQRNPRERVILAVGGGTLLLVALYFLMIEPALSGRAELENSLPALRQQAATFQGQAREAAALAGKGAPNVAPVTRERIESSLASHGLRAQNVTVASDQIRLQFQSASFAELLSWLNEMQRSSRVTVVEANIAALDAPDTVNATLMLRQQRAE